MRNTDTQTNKNGNKFDVIIIGAGHAGVEAALAAFRKKLNVAIFNLSPDNIAFMACNPNIGGTAKGHLAREVDALGGAMGLAADETNLQLKMLNATGGAAVQSLRGQVDKRAYQRVQARALSDSTVKTYFKEVSEVLTCDGAVCGVRTADGREYYATAVVVATGVYLNSVVITGESVKESGPQGFPPATALTSSLLSLGLEIRRFKTGTPPRVRRSSVDFDQMELQTGDDDIYGFSFMTEEPKPNSEYCYLTYTNAETHRLILDNLDRAPLYNGTIGGTGPRYCPSIETKIVRFKDKERHQIFIEPEWSCSEEMYVQGLSTSMPCDVQEKMVHSIKGLEHAEIMRYGYAIEYDCVNPFELTPTLMTKKVAGLFLAGQINGSSGYEEAGAQGIIAGINAAQYVCGEEMLVLGRDEAYTGVLIDDLVTKGTEEPYRMMTARAEYRLTLRQDNADLRLTEKGYRLGYVTEERYAKLKEKEGQIAFIYKELEQRFSPDRVNPLLIKVGESPAHAAMSGVDLLKRANVYFAEIKELIPSVAPYKNAFITVQAEIKYEGYLAKQNAEIKEMKRLEQRLIPADIDYFEVKNLRIEAQEKLNKVKPRSLGQASRISGVSPADIVVMMVHLRLTEDRDA